MDTTRLVRDPRAFWTAQVVLLTPLALFWIGVAAWIGGARDVTEALWRVMFGPTHTLARDLFWPVILPGLALILAGVRTIELRKTERSERADRAAEFDRRLTFALACGLVLSLAAVFVYAIGENLHHAKV